MSACGQRVGERGESRFAAKFGIERVVIDDVVAVGAAGTRLEERRRIEVADAERFQVRHQRGRGVEAELAR